MQTVVVKGFAEIISGLHQLAPRPNWQSDEDRVLSSCHMPGFYRNAYSLLA